MLRYLRLPKGLDHQTGLPAHRALPDAYVTAHHLRDMLNETTVDQLIRWSLQPGLLPRVPSGPHRGKAWTLPPADILQPFAANCDPDIRFSAQTECARRGEGGRPRSVRRRKGRSSNLTHVSRRWGRGP